MKKYAISISDGHNEDWEYYNTKKETYNQFSILKKTEEDIHVYELTDKFCKLGDFNYEVIDSYWIGEEE